MNTSHLKTIFMTISSPAVRRYLCIFPGGVADQLQQVVRDRENLRVIFLVSKKDYARYAPTLNRFSNPRCLVEPVRVNFRRNVIQKFYKFFSSYLLYTGTTKILATMGMRPDEPPAGGNRFFAPLKWLISRTLGRLLWVRKKLAPFLYYLVYPARPFRDLFEKYKPDVVFCSSIYDRFDYHLVPEAKRRGIKTIGMPASWDHVDKYYLPFQTDILIAHSEQIKRAAVKYQSYNLEQIQVTGYPHFDFFTSNESHIPREQLLAAINLPIDARYILYVSGSAYCPDEPDIVETMLSWVEKNDFGHETYIVLRPYLGSRSKDKDFDADKYARLASHPRVRIYAKRGNENFNELLEFINVMRHAAVVMAVYSTAFLESVVFDRPLLAAPFDGHAQRPLHRSIRRFEGFEHFQDVIRLGAMRRAFNFPELKTALTEYLRDPSLDRENRERMRQELCHKLDGNSSQRIVEVILGIIDYR